MRTLRHLAAASLSLVLLASCGAQGAAPSTSPSAVSASACITNFDANTDYFDTKVEFTEAGNVTVEHHRSYRVVTVKKPSPDAPPVTLVLVRCGAPTPELTGDLAQATVITTPVKRVALGALTQVASLELLDSLDRVVAMSDTDAVSSEKARSLVGAGAITSIAGAGTDLDPEKVAAAKPDVVFQPGMPSEAWGKLKELKITSVPDGAWLEATPLGRAEWIKYMSMFLGTEAQAMSRYDAIRADYQATKAKVATQGGKPKVLVGTQYKGEWTVPAGGAYVANFVADAGGDYLFGELEGTGTKKIDQEVIYTKGQAADVWLNGNWMSRKRWATKADALADDPRFASLPAFEKGAVWNPTKRLSPTGGNDYWESGVMRPDLVLADLAGILHPELAAGREPYYYKQLAEK